MHARSLAGSPPAHLELTPSAGAVPGCPDHTVQRHRVTWHHLLTEEPEARKGWQSLHSPAGMMTLTLARLSHPRVQENSLREPLGALHRQGGASRA